jgi:hypothetical protein
MDNDWALIPKEYPRSEKTRAIRPEKPYTTFVDFDIGNGRIGSEAYSWNP